MDSRPIISTDSVNRIFLSGGERVHALKDITIDVMPGTLTVLKGRSGSGKTTLMNILGALDMPTSGKVFFDGREVTMMHEGQKDRLRLTEVGFVFQSVALISLMSAYENVEFALRLAGVPRKLWRPRVEECLSFIGLKTRMKHRPGELSGGEQQRVAIARAIAHRPKVIFADEPTAELDTHMGLQVMKLFRELVKKEGITIVMSTHDPNMMELADHVYSLDDGAIVEETFNTFPGEGAVGA
jgi:putative ABC transport system ATP-binding protein